MKVHLLSGTATETCVYADGWFDGHYGDFIRKGSEKALYLGGQLEEEFPCDADLLNEIEQELRKQLAKKVASF